MAPGRAARSCRLRRGRSAQFHEKLPSDQAGATQPASAMDQDLPAAQQAVTKQMTFIDPAAAKAIIRNADIHDRQMVPFETRLLNGAPEIRHVQVVELMGFHERDDSIGLPCLDPRDIRCQVALPARAVDAWSVLPGQNVMPITPAPASTSAIASGWVWLSYHGICKGLAGLFSRQKCIFYTTTFRKQVV